jgi:hypothetical protein
MENQIILLVLGFLLTSVAGGLLGYYFQQRMWRHQHDVQQREQERQQAIQIFGEVSRMLDQRIYRMRLVYWATRDYVREGNADQMDSTRVGYRKILRIWNDNLNRCLAMTMAYFGEGMRQQLEDLYEQYSSVGRALDQFIRDASHGHAVEIPPIGRRLTVLSHRVYSFNLGMLDLIQHGRLGDSVPIGKAAPAAENRVIQFGDQGPEVCRLQQALQHTGYLRGPADGLFGTDTAQALRQFQESSGISADAIAGPGTWAALNKSIGRVIQPPERA